MSYVAIYRAVMYERAIERARRIIDRADPGLEQRRSAVNAYVAAAIFARMSGVQWMVSD